MDTFISVATLVVAVIGVGGVLAVLRQVRSLANRVESLERKGIPTLGNAVIKQNRQQHILTRATVDAVASLAAIPVVGAPTPSTQGWATTAMVQRRLADIFLLLDDPLVVELGGGSSTVLLARLIKQSGKGRLISIDHNEDYAALTRDSLQRHGLADLVDIRIAPLTQRLVGDQKWEWYHPNGFADLNDINLLFVDGPPGVGSTMARYPAVPLLREHLAPGAAVLVDDANRKDERTMVQLWCAETGATVVATDQVGSGWAQLQLP